jgi:outer membrane receptor protein involved in Fe transport
LNPKFGVQWNITNALQLRAAAFKTVKRFLIVDQTLEPTQIAGFNQFFDDPNGSVTWRYGVGLDAIFGAGIYGGIEVSHRDIDGLLYSPVTLQQLAGVENRQETQTRGYLYWTLNPRWAIAMTASYERFELSPKVSSFTILDTISAPVSVEYFAPTGVFARFGATAVRQDLKPAADVSFAKTHDEFAVFDAALGYRLPNRRGIASVEVRNMFNHKFLYQDLEFLSAEPQTDPRYIPGRTIIARLTLAF